VSALLSAGLPALSVLAVFEVFLPEARLSLDAGDAVNALPFTVRPADDSLPAFASLMPPTRCITSAQSLNEPFLRSSRILPAVTVPTPLTASSSAWLALLMSTDAKAAAAKQA